MPYQTDILHHLKAQGLDVIEVAGWRTRGSSTFNPRGSVNHHTAGPRSGNHPSLNVLINGRPDLPGPLCNVSLARDGKIYLIAAGRANHAGRGGWQGLVGNSSVWGLEVEHTGVLATEPKPSPAHWDKMYRIHAAFALCSGFSAKLVCQHFEWTTRKIDFVNADVNGFRSGVNNYIQHPAGIVEEDNVTAFVEDRNGKWWACNGVWRKNVDKSLVDGWVYISAGSVEVHRKGDFADMLLAGCQDSETMRDATVARIADAVAKKIPAGSGGGLTSSQVTTAVREGLKGLTLKSV